MKLHPFLDGNGRIGRLLIILFHEQKLISTPRYIFRITEENRMEYYDRMTELETREIMNSGSNLLRAVEETSIDIIKQLINLMFCV